MKNILKSIITVTVSVVLCLTAMAQEKFTEGKQTVGDRVFEIRFSEVNVNRMVVVSQLPQYKKGYPLPKSLTPPLSIRPGDMKVDTIVDRRIFSEILKDKLQALRINGERIIIQYVFGQDGNIVDISFYSLARNTCITLKELALIDKRLRNEVKASFKGREYLEFPVIFYGREIRF